MAEIKQVKVGSTNYDIHATTSNMAYGTCATAAATAAKVVTIVDNDNWSLVTGAMVTVKFTETNTAASPTLNVNGTGDKPIYYNNAVYTSSSSYGGYANRHITYQYDGTNWVFVSWGYDSNSDTKVQQDAAITTAGEYPVLLAYSTATSKVTNAVKKTSTLKYNPSTQILTAPKFKGALTGNADTATTATKVGTATIGSTTQPVYINAGVPTETTYTLGKSVPSDAVFTDTVYTHPSYTARTGKPTANQTPAFGGTATVSQITSDATGHVTGATDRTITIPSTLSNGTGTAGLIKTSSTVTSSSGYTACPVISGVPYYKNTDTTYSVATSSTAGLVKSGTDITVDSSGNVSVNDDSHNHVISNIDNLQTTLDAKVSTSRTVNGKPLSSNISLTASDVGATSFTPVTVSIETSAWSSNTATVSCSAVTDSNTLIVAPAPSSYAAWGNSKIRASAQAAGSITFTCDTVPTAVVSVNIVALG